MLLAGALAAAFLVSRPDLRDDIHEIAPALGFNDAAKAKQDMKQPVPPETKRNTVRPFQGQIPF